MDALVVEQRFDLDLVAWSPRLRALCRPMDGAVVVVVRRRLS